MPTTFSDGDLGSGSLRDAVLQANADSGAGTDTIQLQAGTYQLTIINTSGQQDDATKGDLDITNSYHPLVITGTGSTGTHTTVIDASKLQDRLFEIVNVGTQITLRDLVLTGGLAQDNGIAAKTTAFGGAILNNGGNILLQNVVLKNNTAQGANGGRGASGTGAGQDGGPGRAALGGAIYSQGGTLTINGSTITGNQAIGGQGGQGGTGGNAAGAGGKGGAGGAAQGGGIYAANAVIHLSRSTLMLNQAVGGTGGKGGIGGLGYPVGGPAGPGGNGGSAQGGGIFGQHTGLSLATSTLDQNQALGGAGGAGGIGGSAAGFFSAGGGPGGLGGAGGAAAGGGLFTGGGLTNISDSTLTTNLARGGTGGSGGSGGFASLGGNGGAGGQGGAAQGGGLFLGGGTLTLTASTLDHNQTSGGTGGLGGYGQLGFTTGFSGTAGNGGSGGAGQGGGLYAADGLLTMTNATLAVNQGQGGTGGPGGTEGFGTGFRTGGAGGNGGGSQGGGLYFSTGIIQLTNDTVAQNQILDSIGGAGGAHGHAGIGANGQGGGAVNATAIVNSLNSIFGRDKASYSPDFSGNFTTASYNLLEDGTGSNLVGITDVPNHNIVGTSTHPIHPLLGALANNGGPTKTIALKPGSPAIDAGTATGAPGTDQRGHNRGNPPDMGSYETSSKQVPDTALAAVVPEATATPAPVVASAPATGTHLPDRNRAGDGGLNVVAGWHTGGERTSPPMPAAAREGTAASLGDGLSAANLDLFFAMEPHWER
jgi:hypothetical protein